MDHYDMEKTPYENVIKAPPPDPYESRINRFTPTQQAKIIRRIDLRLVLTLGLLYCTSLMDRTNLSAADIAGSVTS